jgi:F-type H+-transporting ATPase subunit c
MSITKKLGTSAIAATVVTLLSHPAFAQAAETVAKGTTNEDVKMWGTLGGGLAIGLAVLGGGLGQGRAASSALEGIARNPGAAAKIQTPMILGLALIESLVLLAFVVALMIIQKI